ncbi:MAG: hypothetical protein PHE15_01300 [Dehalococcoidales bacterium]|nr:hypothetical protein [Dehalococcoidales bacterium]
MSGKPKHGKGKYAYQAKIVGKKQEQQPVIAQDNVPVATAVLEKKPDTIKSDIRVVAAPVMPAAIPACVKKIDLIFEIKRIGIIAAAILVLLIILSVMLK